MKVLWLCNIVLPDFSAEFGLRKYNIGGWMASMLRQLEAQAGMDIAVCCPIIDSWRANDGVCRGHRYYSYPFFNLEYHDEVRVRFQEILKEFKPDVIHIWGTEYPHTLAMVNACMQLNLLDRVVINIQGLVSVYAQHYYAGVPFENCAMAVEGYLTIEQERAGFIHRGQYEVEALKKAKHVIGRTDWDEACVKRIHPEVRYHVCNETLREGFYRHAGEWRYESCEKHTIFVSQANYPIKGLHLLLKAMPEVLRNYPDTHIYVGGTSPVQPNQRGTVQPYGQYIIKLIEENHLAGHITFLGQLDEYEMVERYKRANVFVSASSIENESNSISEASLIGCPIVYSLVGGVVSRANIVGQYAYQYDAEYMLGFYINKIFEQKEIQLDCTKMLNIVDQRKNTDTLCEIYKAIMEE